VVCSDNANPQAYQEKPGVTADRTVDYQAAKADKNGNIDSHDIERHADLTLHEKLDPNSKSKNVNIADKPNTSKGIYKDYQEALTRQVYRVPEGLEGRRECCKKSVVVPFDLNGTTTKKSSTSRHIRHMMENCTKRFVSHRNVVLLRKPTPNFRFIVEDVDSTLERLYDSTR
jgi:hypothetical protein